MVENQKAEIITMPKLSDTMEVGTLVKWHKNIGEEVKEGDLIADIETDKAVQEFESEFNGFMLYRGLSEGESAKVDSVLAVIGPKNTDIKSVLWHTESGSPQAEYKKNSLKEQDDNSLKKFYKKDNNSEKRILASPLARKMSRDKSIQLSKIKGTGINGRIIKRDVENYQLSALQYRELMPSNMRKVIAKRLAISKFTAPHYYLIIEVDMKNSTNLRKTLNQHYLEYGIKISYNDLVIKAAAIALSKHPKINTSWNDDKIIFHKNINIGVAVAVEDGLLVPVVFYADKKNLREISIEIKDKVSRAKMQKLQSPEMEGSTFTVSNLGMLGIETFTSIINQPNSCILSVGAILEKPLVKNSKILPGKVMKISLACDHRTVDGVVGSAYLQTLKKILENPILMLV